MSTGSTSNVVTCPNCEKRFKTKTDMSGKKIRCPGCQKVIAVPAASAAVKKGPPPMPEPEPVAVAAAAPAIEEEENDDPYHVKEQDLRPRCPNCANEMADENATICLYCGYNTLTREWGKTEKVIGATGGDYFKHLFPGVLSLLFSLGLVCTLLYYCVVAPISFKGNRWLEWTDHESLRMWSTFIIMFMVWGSAFYAYKRLLVEPKPPEIKKD